MRHLTRLTIGIGLSAALALGSLGCGAASSDGHPGRGVVKNLDEASRTVTLDHEDIPGLMKGMTMDFDLAPDVQVEDLEPGTVVDFRVKEDRGAYIVTQIRRSSP